MTLVDAVISVVLVLAAIVGLVQGFIRSFFGLAGVVLGISLACWNYGRPARFVQPWVHSPMLAGAIGFIFIVLTMMLLVGLTGWIIAKIFRFIGLGWIDMMGGAVFGFAIGALLVAVSIVVSVAFFPTAKWMTGSRLPPMFFGVCDRAMDVSPANLSKRVRDGMAALETQEPSWMH